MHPPCSTVGSSNALVSRGIACSWARAGEIWTRAGSIYGLLDGAEAALDDAGDGISGVVHHEKNNDDNNYDDEQGDAYAESTAQTTCAKSAIGAIKLISELFYLR